MMLKPQRTIPAQSSSLAAYIIGFVLSIVLTLISFGLLALHNASGHTFLTHGELKAIFVGAAILQLSVQLLFFLHLGQEQKPRLNVLFASLALLIVVIVVGGSLWIMSHLQHTDLSNVYSNGIITPQHEQD